MVLPHSAPKKLIMGCARKTNKFSGKSSDDPHKTDWTEQSAAVVFD